MQTRHCYYACTTVCTNIRQYVRTCAFILCECVNCLLLEAYGYLLYRYADLFCTNTLILYNPYFFSSHISCLDYLVCMCVPTIYYGVVYILLRIKKINQNQFLWLMRASCERVTATRNARTTRHDWLQSAEKAKEEKNIDSPRTSYVIYTRRLHIYTSILFLHFFYMPFVVVVLFCSTIHQFYSHNEYSRLCSRSRRTYM